MRAGFCKAHQMFQFQIVIQLSLVIRRKRAGFAGMQQFGDPAPGLSGRCPSGDVLRGRSSGDEIDDFLVDTSYLGQLYPISASGPTIFIRDAQDRI
jgi:hypothetical protein